MVRGIFDELSVEDFTGVFFCLAILNDNIDKTVKSEIFGLHDYNRNV